MVIRRAACLALLVMAAAAPALAQTRSWRPEDRTLITSFDEITALAIGRDVLYAASVQGIAVRDLIAERWQPPLAPIAGYPAQGSVTALEYDPISDGLWLGTESGELFQLAFAFGEWTRAGFRADGPIIRLRHDIPEGVLWAGTPAGWYRVSDDGGYGRFITNVSMLPDEVRRSGEENLALMALEGTLGLDPQLQRHPVLAAVRTDRPGVFFFGTAGGGLVRVNTNSLERTWYAFGTPSRGVGSVEVAESGIWFGGDGQGPRDGVALAPRDLSRWTRWEAGVDRAPRGFVARIVATADATWFAASDGLWRLRGADDWLNVTTADGLPADQTTSVLPTPGGAWVGTLRGLARIDAEGHVLETFLTGTRILDLAVTGDTLWIGTDRGLVAAIEGEPPVEAPGVAGAPALSGGPVVAVATHGGRVAALTPDALFTRDGATWSGPVRDPAAAGLGTLYRLRFDPAGGIWIAGEGGVAALEEGRPWRSWHVPGDIPSGPVRGLALDGDDLWVATPAGALRIDRTR